MRSGGVFAPPVFLISLSTFAIPAILFYVCIYLFYTGDFFYIRKIL